MKKLALLALMAVLTVMTAQEQAEAGRRKKATIWSMRFAETQPWHGNYSHTEYGTPVAMVVPPTAHTQVKRGWGVAQSEMVPIYHQFMRPAPVGPGAGGGGTAFRPTPRWPSHTDQFGVYYVRGPWGATAPRTAQHYFGYEYLGH